MANKSASADLDLFSLSLHDDPAFRQVRPKDVGKPVPPSASDPELEQDPPQQGSSAEAASQSDAATVLQSDGATDGVDQEAHPASSGMSRDWPTRPSPPPKRGGGRKKRETAPPISAPLRCAPTPPARFLNVHGVAARYGVSVPTIWRWLKNGMGLPGPIHLSNGTTRWRIADLDAFDDALAPKPSDTIGKDAVSSTGGGVSMPRRRR